MHTSNTPLYLVDYDSTLNLFDEQYCTSLNVKFGTNYRVEDMTHWNWVRELPVEQVKWIWSTEAFDSKDWTMAIPPAPGALHAVHRMIDSGAYVVVLSSRPSHHGQWLREWLDDKGLKDAHAWVSPMKLAFAQEFGATLAFEDSPHHAVELATHCPVYLMDRPWNQEVAGENITRVKGLWEAADHMEVARCA